MARRTAAQTLELTNPVNGDVVEMKFMEDGGIKMRVKSDGKRAYNIRSVFQAEAKGTQIDIRPSAHSEDSDLEFYDA